MTRLKYDPAEAKHDRGILMNQIPACVAALRSSAVDYRLDAIIGSRRVAALSATALRVLIEIATSVDARVPDRRRVLKLLRKYGFGLPVAPDPDPIVTVETELQNTAHSGQLFSPNGKL